MDLIYDNAPEHTIIIQSANMRPCRDECNGRTASSDLLSQSKKLRYAVAFVLLFTAPNANSLTIPTPRLATRSPLRQLQLGRQYQHYTTQRYNRLYRTISSSDSASLEQQTVNASTNTSNVNITEKIESEIQQEQAVISQQIEQEKEELQVAVNEVKEAVVEVSQSAKNLGGTVVRKGPRITANFLKLWVSEAFR